MRCRNRSPEDVFITSARRLWKLKGKQVQCLCEPVTVDPECMNIVRDVRTVTGENRREGVSCMMMDEPGNLPDVRLEGKNQPGTSKNHYSSEEKSK